MTTYKFKLYKDDDFNHLHDIINVAGIIYNHCIALHKRYYKDHAKYLNKFHLQKHMVKWKRRRFAFWKVVGSQATQNVIERIDEAYKRFFDNLKKGHARKISPPSFQKVKKYKSVTYKQAGYKFLEGNVVKIQGRKYRYHKSREIEGKVKTMTLKRTPLGEFFITVVTDYVATGNTENKNRTAVGIDFGLKTFLNLSTGDSISSPLFLHHSLKKLKQTSRRHSKKQKGSNNRNKSRLNLVRLHEKVANQRRDWFWKQAQELCKKFDVIACEDLNLQGMQQLWGRKVSDLGFAEFLKILETQAKKYRTKVVYVDRFFPSSKRCSVCGRANQELQLSTRTWKCTHCGTEHDRDVNASRNILYEGLKQIA